MKFKILALFYADSLGADCSVQADVPPVISGLRFGHVCDIRVNPCPYVSLFASGWSYSETFSCRVVSTITAMKFKVLKSILVILFPYGEVSKNKEQAVSYLKFYGYRRI